MSKQIIVWLAFLFIVVAQPLKAQTLMTMIALEEKASIDKNALAKALKEDWGFELDPTKMELSESTGAFSLDGNMLALMSMDAPIPWADLEGPCKYAGRWPEATAEMKKHKAHLIPVLMSSKLPLVEQHKLLTKFTSTLLKLSKSIGVYSGQQELVTAAADYQEEAQRMKDGKLPIANWFFIGMATTDKGISAFTLGLEEFGYNEFEILKSGKTQLEVYTLLYDLMHYVVASNVKLKNGETVGFTAEQKIPVKLTKSEITGKKKVWLLGF